MGKAGPTCPNDLNRGKGALARPRLAPVRGEGVRTQIFLDRRANLVCDGPDYSGVLALDHHPSKHLGSRVPDQ